VAQTGRKAIVLRRAVVPAGESGLPTIEESGAGYSDEAREFASGRSIEISLESVRAVRSPKMASESDTDGTAPGPTSPRVVPAP